MSSDPATKWAKLQGKLVAVKGVSIKTTSFCNALTAKIFSSQAEMITSKDQRLGVLAQAKVASSCTKHIGITKAVAAAAARV